MSDMQEAAFNKAVLLVGALAEGREELLRFFCANFLSSLILRLREGLTEEAYGDAIASAAALLAGAALLRMAQEETLEEFKAGDLTVKQSGGMDTDAAARSLEDQARLLAGPFLEDSFCFSGV